MTKPSKTCGSLRRHTFHIQPPVWFWDTVGIFENVYLNSIPYTYDLIWRVKQAQMKTTYMDLESNLY